jgi:hypothetical protein
MNRIQFNQLAGGDLDSTSCVLKFGLVGDCDSPSGDDSVFEDFLK